MPFATKWAWCFDAQPSLPIFVTGLFLLCHFDLNGDLCAKAAHIPVHLGSMAYAMRDVIDRLEWREGDMVVFNDPSLGGTHLSDVPLIAFPQPATAA